MGAPFSLIEENSLRTSNKGYEFLVHLNWYRSLPLSSVVSAKVQLDGMDVDSALITFGFNDHEYSLVELEGQIEEFWFVQDGARLIINQPGKVKQGEAHTIQVEIALRFPYIPIGPDKFLTIPTKYSSTQVAA
jgi:hypothetical protein